jgi:hypothetical protein
MNKLLFTLSAILLLTTFYSCSPDADEAEQQSINAQNQLKTIRIDLICDVPIGSSGADVDALGILSTGGSSSLNSTIPNHVGQNTITQTFTAAPSSNLYIDFSRANYYTDSNTGLVNCVCGNVTLNVYADDALFHTVTKEVGGINLTSGSVGCPCPDGTGYNITIIVPQ